LKKPSKNKLKKWLNVFIMFLLFVLFYKLYELDIQAWSCDVEENTGSCLLTSRIYLESGNLSMAEKYLRSSCKGEYPLGCFELGNFLIKKGSLEEGKKVLTQSCELGHKPACP
jgi:TPR repeat protein